MGTLSTTALLSDELKCLQTQTNFDATLSSLVGDAHT